ncbi:TPA: hypothetical protein N2A14_002580 [Pseudomonas aeruginosa]|nr:hypothetical protein [Pseudomonas aeruginosa]
MGLISTTIPNLVNGVSQQPYALRLASQCEEQINGYSSVVEGLRKRPGTRHIKKFTGIGSSAYIHTINRDSNERYVVVLQNGSIRVFDLAGNEKTVTTPNGVSYLSASDPASSFRCMTVADYTFILNKTVTVAKAASTIPARAPEALVWVRQGSYGASYKVYIDGGGPYATFTAPDGSQASHVTQVTTDYIAEQLRAQLANLTDFNISRIGSTLYITRKNGGTFSISTDDSIGDNGIKVVKGKIQRFSDLPARAVDGFVVEVTGDQSSSFDNYYVKYDASASGTNGGVWKETAKGGEYDALNALTMPHALVRNSDGTFTFKPLTWDSRKVGDLDSNPMPSFVDRKIADIFFHRNRLGLIADESIVFSKAGSYFDFFIGTATSVLDDDPIDVSVSHTKVSILRHAIPFNETLLLFSDQTQFQLGAADLLTPNTISVNQTTEYECSLRAKPIGTGRYVYFAVNRGSYTGIREYYLDGNTKAEDAAEITGHVPKYIPGDVFKLAASGNEDVIVALSAQAPNQIFAYKFYWSDGEKLQASWSRWVFDSGDKILNCDFIESQLYLVIQRADGVHLEVMDLEPGAADDGWDFLVSLDSVTTQATFRSITFNQGNASLENDDTTTIVLPYLLPSTATLEVICGVGGSRVPGMKVTPVSIGVDATSGNTSLVLKGNFIGQPLFIGKVYELRYRFSTLVIKEEAAGGGMSTVGEGRIQLRKLSLLYNKSGYFRVEVTPFRRDTYRYTFSGRVVGSGKNLIGQVSIEQGKFSLPIMAKNDNVTIEIVNDTFLPCYFLSAEWEAYYTIRSQRL